MHILTQHTDARTKLIKLIKEVRGVAKGGGLQRGEGWRRGVGKKWSSEKNGVALTFAIPILLLYSNIILFAALAGRTFLQPTEFLMADHTPFLRPPLSLSFSSSLRIFYLISNKYC